MRRFPNPTKSQQGAPKRRPISSIAISSRSPTRPRALTHRRRARRVLRAVHDRGIARHHLDHDAQRALRVARRLSGRHRARDEQGVPGDSQGRTDPADRRARSRDGPHHDVPRSVRQRFRQALRAPRRRDQQGHRGHSARARAAARLLRQLGGPAHPRHPAGEDPAGALHRPTSAR